MTGDPSQHSGPIVPDPLYELLPPVFRMADIVEGYPLFALMRVFETVRTQIGTSVTALELDWFIETCPLELVPYIGAMLGVDVARPVRPEHRALVADTLGFRRRKGTAAALPRLIRDRSGWYALYQPGDTTPPASWPLADLPPETSGTDVGSEGQVGAIRVWRLPSFPVIGATPGVTKQQGYSWFNTLGLALPLYGLPSTPLDWSAAPLVTELPVPITVAMLDEDLTRYNRIWARGGPPDSLFYGPGRGLMVRTQDAQSQWVPIPPNEVRAMSLAEYPFVAPDFPVIVGGALNPATIAAGSYPYELWFGDASATFSVEIADQSTMAELVSDLQTAIENATITAGTIVSADDVKALLVGSVGSSLVVVPTMLPGEALYMSPTTGSPNPLQINQYAKTGTASATLPLDDARIALLTSQPGRVMTFTAPAGQQLSVPLPLRPATKDAAGIAAAIAADLTNCFVCAAGGQVVIVPPPEAPPPPVAPTPPAWEVGLVAAVAIDPELGLLRWPSGISGTVFSVDYGMAFPGAIGGTGLRPKPPIPDGATVSADAGNTGWLSGQLSLWAQSSAISTVLVLQSSASRFLLSQSLLPRAGQSLWIAGAEGSQPYLLINTPSQLILAGPMSGAAGSVGLSGLVVSGVVALTGGNLDVTLADTTVYPGTAAQALLAMPPPPPPPTPGVPPPPPATSPTPGTARVALERSIVGPVDLTGLTGSFDAGSSVIADLPAPDLTAAIFTTPSAIAVTVDRVTMMGGATVAGNLTASNSIFAGSLTVSGKVRMRDCYVEEFGFPGSASGPTGTDPVPGGAAVTYCSTCGKPLSIELKSCLVRSLALDPAGTLCTCTDPGAPSVRACASCTVAGCAATCPLRRGGQFWIPIEQPLRFADDNRYPLPGFARLSSDNSPEILTGAENRDELGAYNLALPTARLAGFEAALEEGSLFGTSFRQAFES